MKSEVLWAGILVINVPVESIFKAYIIDFYI